MTWKLEDGRWLHRPLWKRVINTVLRALQPRRRRKLVVFTKCIDGDPPRVVGYGIGFVEHRR